MAAKKRGTGRKTGPPVLDATPVEQSGAQAVPSTLTTTSASPESTTAAAEPVELRGSPSPASMRAEVVREPTPASQVDAWPRPRLRLPDRTEPGTDALAAEAPSIVDGPSQIEAVVGFDAGTESGLVEVTPDRVGVNLRAVAIGLLIGIIAGLVVVLILSNLVLE